MWFALISTRWQIWQDVAPLIVLCNLAHGLTLETLLVSSGEVRSQIVDAPVARSLGWPLGAEGQLWPTGRKKLPSSVLQPEGNEFRAQPEWRWKHNLTKQSLQVRTKLDTLIAASEDSKQRPQLGCTLTPDLEELWDHECVAFSHHVYGNLLLNSQCLFFFFFFFWTCPNQFVHSSCLVYLQSVTTA